MGRRERVIYAVPVALTRRPHLLHRLVRRDTPIALVSPRLVTNRTVEVVEEDILAPIVGRWDVIRAANIANRGYFPEATLRVMLSHLAASLAPGGVLALCRTVPHVGNQASVFRTDGTRLRLVGELNGGSEVADLIPAGRP